ncbi:class I SAM-dependent methyltransferase [Paenibacillus medicaginis]|uniref:Class I SAM-dependent methyltransferase n=1 Tax=Paenibacillus medicaginis TaxID=1470560 RepID=A0ABV5C2D6_9BACL
MFTREVSQMVPGKKVLDIGCGHGEYTLQWSAAAQHITGLDATAEFIKQANETIPNNVSFIMANTKSTLPFADGAFDCAYNRRGPTSAYLDVKRVVRKGGKILGLHPGDNVNAELSTWFPVLFEPPSEGTLILNQIKRRLVDGELGHAEVETVRSFEYLHEPVDVIKMACFGQKRSVFEAVVQESMDYIITVFQKNASGEGLPVTFERYIVRGDI